MPAPKTVHGAVARIILGYCATIGRDVAALRRAAGLAPSQLDDPDQRIPAPALRALWREALRATADPALALTIAGQANPAMFGLVGHLALISRNVGEAIAHLCRYQRLLADDAFWEVRRTGGRLFFSYAMEVPPDDDVWRQGVELSLAQSLAALRFLTGRPLRPARAEFAFPDPGCRPAYAAAFGCPVTFAARHNRLEFPATITGFPILTSQPALAPLVRSRADSALRDLDANLPATAAVRRALAVLIPAGRGTLPEVAGTLGWSNRTAVRRLAAEATSFRDLLAECRFAQATALLEQRDLGIAEIAFRLGYADLTGFTRAFRRRAGCPPGTYRRRLGKTA